MSRESRKRRSVPQALPLQPNEGSFRYQNWILGALLVCATILTYQQAWHAGYIWDDDVYVTGNRLLTAPDGLRRIWFSLDSPSQYFPLVYTTFRWERALWGLNPAGYHWVNILLHAANALLVWRLLRVLRVPGAWLGAAFFALHPVQVESVAWITERKNVLMGFFFLLALLAWVEFVAERPRGKWKFYGLALICYALALFSKTTACTLPAALLLVLWLQHKPINRRRLLEVAPFVALGLAMGLVSVWWERYHQGAQGQTFAIGFPERVLIACRALWFYAGKLVWPTELTFIYPRWTISAADPLAYLWVAATAGVGVAIYFGRRLWGRGVEVAAVFFVATLSPLLGFLMLYAFRFSFVADHYQYLAVIGPLALAAAGIDRTFRVARKSRVFLQLSVSGAILIALSVLTWRQCGMYRDLETLWRTTIERNPKAWMAYNNLGNVLLQNGRVEEAIAQFQAALKIDPRYATAESNLGNAFLRLGQGEKSLTHLRRAVEFDPRDAEAHNNLGNTLLQLGHREEAAAEYRRAFAIDPGYAEAHNNLGALLLQKGETDDAVSQLQNALQLSPDNPDAHNNLGNALLQLGREGEAVAQYRKALELRPEDANTQNNLAWLLATSPDAQIRNGREAVELAERADRSTGNANPVIVATLSAAYAEAGRFAEAVKTARRALDLAAQTGHSALVGAIRAQVELYESGSPSREAPK